MPRKDRNEIVAAGLCRDCGRARDGASSRLCAHCWERARSANQRWVSANHERHLDNARVAGQRNRERRKAQWRQRYATDPSFRERIMEEQRRQRRAHHERTREQVHRRRARVKGAGGSYTVAEWRALLERYGHRCLACGRTDVKLHPDHVVPIALGGSNAITNIQPLCRSCNSKKGATVADYRGGLVGAVGA